MKARFESGGMEAWRRSRDVWFSPWLMGEHSLMVKRLSTGFGGLWLGFVDVYLMALPLPFVYATWSMLSAGR